MNIKETIKNKSVEKLFAIIEIMSEHDGPIQLKDLALKADLPTPTALRFVNTMVSCGYARQDADTLKYSLTLKLSYIGDRINSHYDIREIAHPYLEELQRKCKETTCLGIENNRNVLFIDAVNSVRESGLSVIHQIGTEQPMHCIAIGKILLSHYSKEEIEQYLSKQNLNSITPKTITTAHDLAVELEKIRSDGYAVNDEECYLGLRCIAAPVYNYQNRAVAGISISGPCARMTKEYIDLIVPVLVNSARSLSKDLGFVSNEAI
jgi:IclR family KDG regulon transcriptional repressor